MTSTFLSISRIILVVFTAILIVVLPQLNIQEYVLPTISSKMIYFLYGCMILCIVYTFIIVFSKEISLSFSKIDIALFALVLYITFNRYFIQSYYGFSIRYIELLGLSFFYVVLRTIALKYYPWLLLSIVISGIMQAVYGNLQLFEYYPSNHSGFKMTGSFFNPGPYAGFLVSVWTVALGLYLFKDNIIKQLQSQKEGSSLFLDRVIKCIFEYVPLLGLICIAIILPATQSRASWIAALLGSVALMELKYHYLKNILKKITVRFQKTVLILISLVILSTGIFSLYNYKKASSDGRAFIWKVTSEMIVDTPFFGVGFDRFKVQFMNYQANYFAKNGETSEVLIADNVYYAFNEGLQFVSENGFMGLVLLLIVIYVLFRTKENEKYSLEAIIAKTGLLTIGVFAFFSYPMQILPIKIVLFFLIAVLTNNATPSFQFEIAQVYLRKQWMYKLSFVLLACIALYPIYSYTNDLSKGFVVWNNALSSHQYGDYNEAIEAFELVYPTFKKDGDFLMNYGKTLSIAGEYAKATTVLEQAKKYLNNTVVATSLGDSYKVTRQYDKAEIAYQQAINMTPGKFYPNYLLAKFYDASGQEEKAIIMAVKILKKPIKIPSTAIKEIRGEMKNILIKYKNPPGFKN